MVQSAGDTLWWVQEPRVPRRFLTLVQERVTPEERKSIWACQTARRKKRADQKTRNKVARAHADCEGVLPVV